jgi:hypothetical protein
LGFVIFFVPVTNQNRAGDVLNHHLRTSPFQRMPGFETFTVQHHRNTRASVERSTATANSRQTCLFFL